MEAARERRYHTSVSGHDTRDGGGLGVPTVAAAGPYETKSGRAAAGMMPSPPRSRPLDPARLLAPLTGLLVCVAWQRATAVSSRWSASAPMPVRAKAALRGHDGQIDGLPLLRVSARALETDWHPLSGGGVGGIIPRLQEINRGEQFPLAKRGQQQRSPPMQRPPLRIPQADRRQRTMLLRLREKRPTYTALT